MLPYYFKQSSYEDVNNPISKVEDWFTVNNLLFNKN